MKTPDRHVDGLPCSQRRDMRSQERKIRMGGLVALGWGDGCIVGQVIVCCEHEGMERLGKDICECAFS